MTSSTLVNEQITSETLPDLQALTKQPLSASYAKTNRMVKLFTTFFLVTLLFIVMNQSFYLFSINVLDLMTYACWIIAGLGFVSTGYSMLADPLKSYALREHDLSYSSGLIFRKTVTQPILRIQHIELKRGPIERKVGLATLQVFSAGGALETFQIPGLPIVEAQKLREFILRHKGSTQNV
jgi:membrane protein YdbS with pleckstrin-like domain